MRNVDEVFLPYGDENQFGFLGNHNNLWIQEENGWDYILTKEYNPDEKNFEKSVFGEITAKKDGSYGAFILRGCHNRERLGTFRTIESAEQVIGKKAMKLITTEQLN